MRARHIAGVMAGLICVGAMAGAARAEEEKLSLRVRAMRAYVKAFFAEDDYRGISTAEEFRAAAERYEEFVGTLTKALSDNPEASADRDAVTEMRGAGLDMVVIYKGIANQGGIKAVIYDEEKLRQTQALIHRFWELRMPIDEVMKKWTLKYFGAAEWAK